MTARSTDAPAIALDPAPAFGQHGHQAARPLPQRLEPDERVTEVVAADRRRARLGGDDVGIEPAQPVPQLTAPARPARVAARPLARSRACSRSSSWPAT